MARDLIVFAEDWGGLPSSTQHLIKRLSKDRKILWINSIGIRQPQMNTHDLKRIWKKITSSVINNNSVSNITSNIVVVNPATLPAPREKFARMCATSILNFQLQPIIKKFKLRDPIVWTSLPTALDIINKLNPTSLVYYVGDDYSSLEGVDKDLIQDRENKLAEKANLIIAASKSLFARFPHGRTGLLPHGVDYSLFATPCERAKDLPNDGRPIAGYYGSLSDWIDYPLLIETIKKQPQWHFVFIGKESEKTEKLAVYENVHILGPRDYDLLPSYSQHWSVGIIPFKNNGQIRACNPLKLKEYMAAGRPVITTDFPALDEYRSFVHCIKNANEMAEVLIENANAPIDTKQQAYVKKHTWDERAEVLSRWLDAL